MKGRNGRPPIGKKTAALKPVGKIGGQNVFELPAHVGTREIVQTPEGVCVHSLGALLQLVVAKVIWHDTRQGCPTWTGGAPEDGGRCACDVEGGGFPIERHHLEQQRRLELIAENLELEVARRLERGEVTP